MKKLSTRQRILNYIMITLGSAIAAFGYSVFYLPSKIVSGGVSGVSTILYHALKLEPGVTMALINIALLIVSVRFLGTRFAVSTLFGAGLFSLFIQIFSKIPQITDDPLLSAIFGAILYGFGVGLALVYGASTGGTDIIARLIQHFAPHFPIGKLLMGVDGVIILSSFFVFSDTDLLLYGIIALFVATNTVDLLIRKLNVSSIAYIITSKGDDVRDVLISNFRRGVTQFDVIGGYTGEKKQMLMCALKVSEIPAFEEKVTKTDPDVFLIYSESRQIVGQGFSVYR